MQANRALALLLLLALPSAIPAGAETLPDIRRGTRIKAEGVFPAGEMVLDTAKLRIRDSDDDDFELSGMITRLHAETIAFRVHGVWVLPTGDDLSRRDLRRVERLEVGDWVKVEGEWNDRMHLVADSVEPLHGEQETAVEGIVQHVDRLRDGSAEVDLGGVQLGLSPKTRIRGPK
jgi:hypothetical protein